MVIYLTMLEIIVIIAAISFVVAVFTKAIINHMHGKCNCDDCESCNGSCKKYTKEELKKHLEETYLK